MASISTEDVTLSPAVVDCGAGSPDEMISGKVAVTNRTDRPVRLIGGTSDCSCSTTDSLPLTIPPWQTVEIVVRVRVPQEGNGGESFVRTAEILVADDGLRPLELGLTGRVTVR